MPGPALHSDHSGVGHRSEFDEERFDGRIGIYFAAAVTWQTRVIELTPEEDGKEFYRYWLKLDQDNKPYRDKER